MLITSGVTGFREMDWILTCERCLVFDPVIYNLNHIMSLHFSQYANEGIEYRTFRTKDF